MTENKLVRPFLKWAGGKRQLLPEIQKYVPKKYQTYYEPFLGGGAVLFGLQPKKAVVNDSNSELINCYKVIKDSLDDLMIQLRTHKEEHEQYQESYFYKMRDLDRSNNYKNDYGAVQRAARIIYLNKTCFNGLFRVNSSGQFNVPFGKYKKPNILDEAVLKAVNKYLNRNKIDFLNKDFEEAVSDAKKGDFVYFDPPYDPVSITSSFTGYDVNCFNRDEQKRLKEVFDDLDTRGCKILLSNAATGFILNLYSTYKIDKVLATRAINSKALRRGKVPEVLVRNYE
ncbi:MAG: DNA adenine methylase [Symploca sp. SIO2E9]|nr:DNA adenine methylase [Symploca sp. SIO2E9]